MRSNGFGSMEQTIVIHVPNEQAVELASLLDCVPLKHKGEAERSYFTWNRWTTRTADDEDVVFELFILIGGPHEELNWTIDWDLSEY